MALWPAGSNAATLEVGPNKPYPQLSDGSSCGTYECDAAAGGHGETGVIDVEDWAGDPRVSLSYPGRTGPPRDRRPP